MGFTQERQDSRNGAGHEVTRIRRECRRAEDDDQVIDARQGIGAALGLVPRLMIGKNAVGRILDEIGMDFPVLRVVAEAARGLDRRISEGLESPLPARWSER